MRSPPRFEATSRQGTEHLAHTGPGPIGSIRRSFVEAFDGDTRAWGALCRRRDADAYDPQLADHLLGMARGDHDEPWALRCFVILLLESLVARLPPTRVGEHVTLFEQLGLIEKSGRSRRLSKDVLKQGFTTTSLDRFIREFHRRLRRLAPLYDIVERQRFSTSALTCLVRVSGQESRLFLARYLFTPQEVVERVLGRVRTSTGDTNRSIHGHPSVRHEARRTLEALPCFEASIIKALIADPRIFWVAESTPSQLHGLIEYPHGTVVLTVKPPGSHHEFEIKRAGLRKGPPVTVEFEDEHGQPRPPMHRFWGGNMAYSLSWEARQGAQFSQLYRDATDTEPPISHTVSSTLVRSVPTSNGDARIIEYLTDQRVFGAGFDEMRRSLKRSITAFGTEREWYGEKRPGEHGKTLEFLDIIMPGQSTLVGSSSFRLDRLVMYLSERGADHYFEDGLKVSASKGERRGFADDLLDEILDKYHPPEIRYRSHRHYLASAFRMPANRAAADRCYLSIMAQIGTFWAVFLATRTNSRGESFTPRNVGLRKCWDDGRWWVKVIFMDHDDLQLVGRTMRYFWPNTILRGINMDRAHLLDGIVAGGRIKGSAKYLQEIYRADERLTDRGRQVFMESLRATYRQTFNRLRRESRLREFFVENFINTIGDWDKVMSWYFHLDGSDEQISAWEKKTIGYLETRGYNDRLIREYVRAPRSISYFIDIFREIIAPGSSA